ncbi:MAG: cation:proton antiporter [Porticoccaceae bacterium]|nr:cation:proton antiporter [Porticoccaceae bacterium]
MNEIMVWISWLAVMAGVFFFVAGAIGLARFPDIHCRLHAVTKADTLGMGFLVLGFGIRAEHWHSAALMLVIWLLVAASSAVSCHLLARYEQLEDEQ